MLIRVLLLNFSCLFIWLSQTGALVAEPAQEIMIFDGGSMGWTTLSRSCGSAVDSQGIAAACFKKQLWKNLDTDEIEAQIKEGYISMGGITVQPEATDTATIKVFIFRQHAIDKNGDLYLFAQPG